MEENKAFGFSLSGVDIQGMSASVFYLVVESLMFRSRVSFSVESVRFPDSLTCVGAPATSSFKL